MEQTFSPLSRRTLSHSRTSPAISPKSRVLSSNSALHPLTISSRVFPFNKDGVGATVVGFVARVADGVVVGLPKDNVEVLVDDGAPKLRAGAEAAGAVVAGGLNERGAEVVVGACLLENNVKYSYFAIRARN